METEEERIGRLSKVLLKVSCKQGVPRLIEGSLCGVAERHPTIEYKIKETWLGNNTINFTR